MRVTEIKLPFGIDQKGALVHISEVVNGKNCKCLCPSCRSPLIAAKGTKNQHHFKHANIVECDTGLESAIHLAAKQTIRKRKELTFPGCVSEVSIKDSRGIKRTKQETVLQNKTVIKFDDVKEEVEFHGMKADLLALKNETSLIIEIFYRHRVEDEKRSKIERANISAIEIDLSDLSPEDVMDWDTFWLCINDTTRMQWLYNRKANNDVYLRLKQNLKALIKDIERNYEQERIEQKKKQQREQEKLRKALAELGSVSSEEYIAQLREKAETHPSWQYQKKFLCFSWDEIPDFLNLDVPNGDWIFGCDRRIWQTAIYGYFIQKNGKPFSVRAVDNWLQNTVGCKVPDCAKTVGIYGRRYPNILPDDMAGNLPSSWDTLKAFFRALCDHGLLEFSGPDRQARGSFWYKIRSENLSF